MDPEMTKKQRWWVDHMRAHFLKQAHGAAHADAYEFKMFEFRPFPEPYIAIRVETGRKGDEGTAAEIYCRTRYLVVIGPRGSMAVTDNSFGKKNVTYRGNKAKALVQYLQPFFVMDSAGK